MRRVQWATPFIAGLSTTKEKHIDLVIDVILPGFHLKLELENSAVV